MSTHADTSSEDLGGRRDDLADRRDDLADRRDDRPDAGHADARHDGPATDARRDDDGPGRYTRQHGDHAGQHDHDAQDDQGVSVLDPSASERLRNRWQEVQAGFVDEPRQSVTEADQLVGEVLDEVSRVFRDQRSELEAEWSGNAEPGTEELRQALRRYREFFDRLLSL
ncbi:hypothetical protein GCM10023201_27530 [Actinomycetospora corticicola]|uniref:Uncharacterized protein n=1 Tax=Actinomycetospora corticicola TaxID=663602 RepID=A0A7Y9DX45_9PSEU|nr:hypothetical protein [Actinomycetospora corticicola]NYD37114.1 hypothetical protein [Actinomycetospora corticicola]